MNEIKHISEQQYPFAEVEAKWQSWWEEQGTYRFDPDSPKPVHYVLTMFSYPSGDKLHMGHWYCYAPTDTYARFKRMQGYNVFEPMGFDAFGLPAENYAIKTGVHPAISTQQNIKFMREQLKRIGAMYDWDYEVNTSQPDYYKWTQWWFLLMYKRGLAYQKESLVNWCPNCQTVLANEQVAADNTCERCGTAVIRKKLKQWFYKITEYNQRLLEGLDSIDWPEKTKAMQRYWIGKSEGTEIEFEIQNRKLKIEVPSPPPNPPVNGGGSTGTPPAPPSELGGGQTIRVFTTRADTLFGVTYVVLAPEHPRAWDLVSPDRTAEVRAYVEEATALSEVDRTMGDREKTGVFTGTYATHPLTGERVPIWVADYVIGSYGTGAVMAVPAHDTRDFEFAKKYGLPIKEVIRPVSPSGPPTGSGGEPRGAFTDHGVMMNSGEFDGLKSDAGIRKVGEKLKAVGKGNPTTTWHLRDWTISRQRYWGAPIPVIYCPKCGVVTVPEADLPVLLPENVVEYKPKGRSPLAAVESFINVTCPTCGGPAERDPDTMDTFVDSSWYFMRYPEAKLDSAAFTKQSLNKMLPIAQYVGGSEHATGHLIYSRFFTKVAKDAGYLDSEEPFQRLIHQGMILNKGMRMSKSKGNSVAPEAVLKKHGSDVLRCFMMFMGDYTLGGEWSDQGITGVERFIARVWRLGMAVGKSEIRNPNSEVPADVERKLHQTIKAVSVDLQQFQFNTALARLMELTNLVYGWVGSDLKHVERTPATQAVVEKLIVLLAPCAPHLCEELWHGFGHAGSVFDEPWPAFDEDKARDDEVTIAVQVNGKLRETLRVPLNSPDDVVAALAQGLDKVAAHLDGKQVVKTIVVPNKIVNIVVR
ncbi:leucine--tRNA ligase [candidate division KSB1 bacterium]|nr:leucine--tRNA ligase [candidate division KSB1 bacterium]